jgi:hypothetical protein
LACFEVQVVAMDRPDGLLVDRLLDAGIGVLALHPNPVKATSVTIPGPPGPLPDLFANQLWPAPTSSRRQITPLFDTGRLRRQWGTLG